MSIAVAVDQERDLSCLGASEAPGVLGLDKYNPPIKIWRRHRGLEVDDSTPEWLREPAEWGQILEPVIRGKYSVAHSSRVFVPTFSMTRDGWLRCTPDGLVVPGVLHPLVSELFPNELTDSLRALLRGLVQCKNVDAHLTWEWSDGPPAAKEVQARVEMAVTGLPWCDLAALIGGNRYVEHRVERDIEIEARILADLAAFWDLVQRGIEPTVDHTDAWRLHVSEKMPSAKMITEADPDDVEAMKLLRARRHDRKLAEASEKLSRNDILLRLAQRGATAIRSDEPGVGTVSAYRTKSGTWALRCPPAWGDD